MSPSTTLKASIMRSLIVFVVCLAFFISASPIALAAGASIKLSPTSGPPTSKVTVSGKSFGASEQVSLTFDTTTAGTATTDSSGTFSTKITVPKSALPGNHTVQATGQTSGLSASAPFLVQTNWSMFGYNAQHTNVNPFENVLTSSNVSNLALDWSYATGVSGSGGTVVVNGVAYIGANNNNLYALNATTGGLLWSFTAGGTLAYDTPAVANGVVYIADDEGSTPPMGNIYALNATTGALLWSAQVGEAESPVVSQGTVYIGALVPNPDGTTHGNLWALNAKTGALLWSLNTGNDENFSTPAVLNGVVYINATGYVMGVRNSTVFALNATSGAQIWRFDPSSSGSSGSDSSPAVVNGVVYFGAGDGQVYALNATTGAQMWSYATGGTIGFSSPAVARGLVYIATFADAGSSSGSVYALNATTGTKVWSYQTLGFIQGSPSVANGVVYIGSEDSELRAFNAATGALLWTYYVLNSQTLSSPAVANGVVYMSWESGDLYAFHLPGTTP